MMKLPRGGGFAAAALLLLGACSEQSPTSTSADVLVARDVERVEVSSSIADAARELALALNDASARRELRIALGASPVAEFKVGLRPWIETGRFSDLRASSRRPARLESALRGAVALGRYELYFPLHRDRRSWTPSQPLVVAIEHEDGVLTFDGEGLSTYYLADEIPEVAVLALVTSEMSAAEEQRSVSASPTSTATARSTAKAGLSAIEYLDCPPEDPLECEGSGGGGNGGGGTGGSGPPPSALYFVEMTIWDKAEPWIRGDPEIEVWLLGSQDGYFRALPPPPPSTLPILDFVPGTFLNVLSCAGRLAPSPSKQFDYNGEHGATYTDRVTVAHLADFARLERVRGVGGTLLSSRRVEIRPPFRVLAVERDDGGECPTVNGLVIGAQLPLNEWAPAAHSSFGSYSFTGSLSGVLSFLGITNDNDLMGSWQFADWSSFSSLSSTLLVGSHLQLRVDNVGVSASTIPPPVTY